LAAAPEAELAAAAAAPQLPIIADLPQQQFTGAVSQEEMIAAFMPPRQALPHVHLQHGALPLPGKCWVTLDGRWQQEQAMLQWLQFNQQQPQQPQQQQQQPPQQPPPQQQQPQQQLLQPPTIDAFYAGAYACKPPPPPCEPCGAMLKHADAASLEALADPENEDLNKHKTMRSVLELATARRDIIWALLWYSSRHLHRRAPVNFRKAVSSSLTYHMHLPFSLRTGVSYGGAVGAGAGSARGVCRPQADREPVDQQIQVRRCVTFIPAVLAVA
jgi:hypothetical protein